ncbi:MAG: NAD(P)/FAD-dependent oxidoreductase [Wenzhouxiangella sp.]|nr:NAD(P)/FAD-dependent oxidoreductase [Wenzhouxiangella sp.]
MLIIGAGFSGLALGMRLLERGESDFLILEQADGIGGTWWVNRYPGCACDVQSHLYSLSFVPKPDWSSQFAPRTEIQSYLEEAARKRGLMPHIRLNTAVQKAAWNDERQYWQLKDQDGRVYTGDLLIPALGGLSRPKFPNIPGLGDFAGAVIHSQQWPDDLDLKGKRVAVIGCGASAIQFVPRIQPDVAQLDLYQRTPQWILPKPDGPIPDWKQKLYRAFPPARLLTRLGLYLLLESRLPAFNRYPALSWLHRRMARNYLARQVRDPELRRKLRPDYAMGCKRVLMSNDFYPALTRENVSVITDPIEQIDATGVTSGGCHRPVEVLLMATGFRATAPVPRGLISGRDERDLADCWDLGPEAYKGTTVHGFPNLFMLLGPNTGLGHNSVLLMLESQLNYVLSALDHLDQKQVSVLEPRLEAQTDWNHQLQARLAKTVWKRGGCASWYQHPLSGRVPTLWPSSTASFRRALRYFDSAAYHCIEAPGSQSARHDQEAAAQRN